MIYLLIRTACVTVNEIPYHFLEFHIIGPNKWPVYFNVDLHRFAHVFSRLQVDTHKDLGYLC